MNKDKFNPDINDKIKNKEYERNSTKYNLNTTIYNPITGIIPQNITSNKDLKLNIDTNCNQIDIKKLIMEKERERMEQDASYKPMETKTVNKESNKSENNKYNILNSLKDLGILNK